MNETDKNLGVSNNAGNRSAIAAKLNTARHDLLDLSTRNRLISTSRNSRSSRLVEVSDADTAGIYRELVTEGRAIGFAPREPEDDTGDGNPEPDESGGRARSRREMRLQTSLTA